MTTARIIERLGVWPSDMPPVLAGRRAAALLWARHPDQVRRHCEPVACDVATRAPLYDLDAVGRVLATLKRQPRLTRT